MRRVAVTGMGIVSCIGNNTPEVPSNLREGKSGIPKSEKHVNLGFKSPIYGKPDLDPEHYLDKKVTRFMGM
jgi:3-oxoacyl-(acyl-carrier-protein) synthase